MTTATEAPSWDTVLSDIQQGNGYDEGDFVEMVLREHGVNLYVVLPEEAQYIMLWRVARYMAVRQTAGESGTPQLSSSQEQAINMAFEFYTNFQPSCGEGAPFFIDMKKFVFAIAAQLDVTP